MTYKKQFVEIGSYFNWRGLQYIPKHKISYLEFGEPDNPNVLVCAHGLTRNAHDFDKLAEVLAEDFRIISISYPGRGESDYFANKKHYNYHVYIHDSLKLLEALGIQSPLWLGTSMGGLIGMSIAALKPKLLKGLILNDIGPFMRGAVLEKIRKYVGLGDKFKDFATAKQHLKLIYAKFGIQREDDWDYITNHSFNVAPDGHYLMNYDPQIVYGMQVSQKNPKDVNLWSMWAKVACPLMLIHGAKSDILEKPTVEQMMASKEDITLYTVSYAGHVPALMSDDQISAIKEWLQRWLK